jgi:hypothetical protein
MAVWHQARCDADGVPMRLPCIVEALRSGRHGRVLVGASARPSRISASGDVVRLDLMIESALTLMSDHSKIQKIALGH